MAIFVDIPVTIPRVDRIDFWRNRIFTVFSLDIVRMRFVPYALSARILLLERSRRDKSSTATVESWTFPEVRRNSNGFPSASVRVWILVFRPPFVRPTAFESPFLYHRWHFHALWRQWSQYRYTLYLHPNSVLGISFQKFRPFATCGIEHIRSASFHSIPAVRAIDIRFAVSTTCRSASCGYLFAVFLSDRFAPVADSLWFGSTRLLLLHIVLPCFYYTIFL